MIKPLPSKSSTHRERVFNKIRNNIRRMPTIPRLHKQHRPRYLYLNKSAEYYASKAWRDLRDWYIQRHPLCERCFEQGKITPAEHVHHKTPFLTGITKSDKFALLTDPDNLMSVCAPCHKMIHRDIDNQRANTP